jgi:hypothetical protein
MPSPIRLIRGAAAAWLLTGLPAACSPGGDSPPPEVPDLIERLGNLPPPRNRPSGAHVRIVNAYAPAEGMRGTLEVYPASLWSEGDKPLVTIPYGQASSLFDPTVADESGNMFLAAYLGGSTPKATPVSSWTATLKGGEQITYFLTSSEEPGIGRPTASLHTYEHEIRGDQPRPGPGKGLLIVQGAALYQGLPEGPQPLFYLSVGAACAKSYHEETPGQTPVQQGSGPEYELDPGDYTVSIHPESGTEFPPKCGSSPVVGNIPVRVTAGERSILFIFAPRNRQFATLLVPLTR